MKSVLVLGAAGRVGRAVAEAFRDASWRVKGQVRPGGAKRLPSGIEPVEAEGADAAALARAGEGMDVVFHGLNPLYTNWEREMMPLAEAAVAAAAANKALLLLPGNVYVFGADMPEHLTPDVPFRPTTSKGRLRVALESHLAEEARSRGFKFAVLRAGDFFGGTGKGTWLDLAIFRSKGTFTAVAPMDTKHAWAYLPDLANAFVALAENREKLGAEEHFHFPGDTASMAQMHAAAEKALGRQLKVKSMPWWLFRLASPFSAMFRAVLEMKYLWEVPHGLEDPRLEQVTGPLRRTPLDQAMAKAIKDLG